MKRMAMILALLTVAVLADACDAFSSPTSEPPVAPAATTPVPATVPVPVGACQSRLWGKITNATTGQAAPAKTTVEVESGNRKFKTETDGTGLYGFAGMCAGEYTMTITPPGGKPLPNPNKVSLDGKQATKVDLSFK
ncbi:MAG: carboxypeptidase regulatory-like domain-containing protein [Chloroflexota bacterium]|nr:carboxypeptidase regulatory-like domain-containing protein [Chloroflexota bacterium]